ncbi:hypothetical protein FACS1894164_19820 [Spirochaetia bacterium]|nr:hypothetical protein FACS1894164_19820 [Spirochaetia bacterium]
MLHAEVLTLDQAVARALSTSINLQKGALDLSTAAYAARHTWSEFFPTISAGANIGYNSSSTNLFSNSGIAKATPTYNSSASVSLQLNAGIPSAIKLIQLAYQQQLLTFDDAKRQLTIQVTKTFYSLIAEKDHVANVEETLTLTRRQYDRIRTGFQTGLSSQLDVRQSELSVRQAELDLSSAQASYSSNMRSFLTLVGVDYDSGLELQGTLTVVPVQADPEQLIRDHLSERPDIRLQRQTIERLIATKQQNDWKTYAPSISLSWGLQTGASFGSDPSFRDPLGMSLSVTIPINPWIPGTKDYQNVQSTNTNIEKARLDLKNTEDQAKAQIRSLTENLRNLWNAIEIARLQVQIAEETYTMRERAFRVGAVESLTLENTRQARANAEYQLLTRELSYWNTMLDLAAAVNIDWRAFMENEENR